MPAPKLNFVQEKKLRSEHNQYTPALVSIRYNKASEGTTLTFRHETIEIYDLDGKYIRMYGDVENRIIGWSIIEGNTSLEELKDCRKLEKMGSTGQITIGVTKLLSSIGIRLTESINNLPVKKYTNPLFANDIYYIEIPREEVKL